MIWQALIYALCMFAVYELATWRERKNWKVTERSLLIYIESLKADKKEAWDRLYQSKGYAPTGIDITAQYVEKQAEKKERVEDVRKNGKPPIGPLERRVADWTKKDRADVSRGVDLTSSKTH